MTEQRRLPSIDQLLSSDALAPLIDQHGRAAVKDAVTTLQNSWRESGEIPPFARDATAYGALIAPTFTTGYPRVLNMTGTLLHTNLGRALIGREIAAAAINAASHPIALEYDIDAGARGERDASVTERLCRLTGAEAATIVNNNAAAVLLVLNTLAEGKEVPVSRGELVEIGGSFRIPDIIARAGAKIREVGATNRTHPRDVEAAIGAETGMLLKVHPSNYHIEGFTRQVSLSELADIGKRHAQCVVEDLGSGALIDVSRYGLPHEPTPAESLAAGADVVTFSGDKLLGGVQAGFIVGRADYIAKIRANALRRALRPDKITLVIANEVLKAYEHPEQLESKIPLLAMLAKPVSAIERAAAQLAAHLQPHLPEFSVSSKTCNCQVGSGSLPSATVPSAAVAISHKQDRALRDLQAAMRELSVPVIGRLHDGELLLDLRSCDDWPLAQSVLAELAT